MKKLILLLTLALSFSFANAKSIWITIYHYKESLDGEQTVRISIIFPKENSFTQYESFAFNIGKQKSNLESKTNEEKLNKLNLIISDKLKMKSTRGTKQEFHPKLPHPSYLFKNRFLELLIGNDWMITEYDDNDKDEVNIFAYKQDK